MSETGISVMYPKNCRIEIFQQGIFWYLRRRNIKSLFSVSKVIKELNEKYKVHHGAMVLYGRVCDPEKYDRRLGWMNNHVELFSISSAQNELDEIEEDEKIGFLSSSELQKQTSMSMLASRSGKKENELISTNKPLAKQSVEFQIDGRTWTAEVFVSLDFTEEEGPTFLFQTDCKAKMLGYEQCISVDLSDCVELAPGTALKREHKELGIKH